MSNKREALEAAKALLKKILPNMAYPQGVFSVRDVEQAKKYSDTEIAIQLIEAALAEPEQEPVSSQRDAIVVNLVRNGVNKHDARDLANHFISIGNTSPREWQELSRDEAWACYVKSPHAPKTGWSWSEVHQLTIEISAALRAKNGG